MPSVSPLRVQSWHLAQRSHFGLFPNVLMANVSWGGGEVIPGGGFVNEGRGQATLHGVGCAGWATVCLSRVVAAR